MGSHNDPAVCEWVDRETKVHCFRLSESNKKTLLQNAAAAAEERLPKSRAFLERLRKLSPEFARQFELRETAISEAPLRLLVAENSKLVADPYFQVESYIVLSYCWHNEAWKPVPLCKKGWWPVSDVMMKVLQRNCNPEEGIWIDQLCIHQHDLEEQRLAVSAMDQIYKSARKMYAVLEDIALSKAEQNATVAYASNAEIEPSTAANLVLKIASARWFSRAWCSYEFKTSTYLAGQSPVLIIPLEAPETGLIKLEVMGFYPTEAVQSYILRSRGAVETGEAASYLQFLGFLDPVGGRADITGYAGREPDLTIQVLNRIERSGCQFLTDYIPIILNTSGLDIIFSGTINTKDELYSIVSILALAAGDAAVLSASGPKLRMASPEPGEAAISWIHDFGPMDWTVPRRLPEDLSINSVTQEMIDLDLLILETDPFTASLPAMESATAFVRACYEADNPTLSQYYTSTSIGIPKTIAYLSANVATILDLGLPWIRSAWSIFQRDLIAVEERWRGFVHDDPSIWEHIATHLLPYLLKSEASPSDPEDYQSLLMPFFSFFLFPVLRGNVLAPQIIRTGPGATDFALLDTNSHQHSTTPPMVIYAVPAAMASSTFQRSMRVWVLEEAAADGYIPRFGTPGMSYLANQAQRFGGVVSKDVAEAGAKPIYAVEVEPGTITADTWDAIVSEMARVNMHEWAEEQRGGMEALEALNKSSGCWKLVEKAVLWGCPTIVEDGGKTVTLLKGQKVYGEMKIPVALYDEAIKDGWEEPRNSGLRTIPDIKAESLIARSDGEDTMVALIEEGGRTSPTPALQQSIAPFPESNREHDWPESSSPALAAEELEETLVKTHLEATKEQNVDPNLDLLQSGVKNAEGNDTGADKTDGRKLTILIGRG